MTCGVHTPQGRHASPAHTAEAATVTWAVHAQRGPHTFGPWAGPFVQGCCLCGCRLQQPLLVRLLQQLPLQTM